MKMSATMGKKFNAMQPQDFRFSHRLRVRWAEVDMQKIVFNSHYLMYFDTALADYWRALALPYEQAMHQWQGDLYVKKATLEYHGSAKYDDLLDVTIRCTKTGRSSILMQGGIFSGDQLRVSAELVYVYADPLSQSSCPLPDALRQILQSYEAGEIMTSMEVGDWLTLGHAAAQVRTEVFVQEQGISREDEWDAADTTAIHAVVSNRMKTPLATARLLIARPGVGKIGRMATKRVLRGSGIGRQVLDVLCAKAKARGDHEVMLHAQQSAVTFYAKSGFVVRGEPFDEVGIAHLEMFKPL
jgi:YbgC/YbaW family acyl-CoA thioester hydrolase